MTSLRSKILTSYGLSITALLIFVTVVIADLHYLQTHIVEGEAVSDLSQAIQKIRRDEKNLFALEVDRADREARTRRCPAWRTRGGGRYCGRLADHGGGAEYALGRKGRFYGRGLGDPPAGRRLLLRDHRPQRAASALR